MAEADAAHVREMERLSLAADAREGLISRVSAVAVPVVAIVAAAAITIAGGSVWVAGILATGALSAPLVVAFLRDRGQGQMSNRKPDKR